MELNAHQKAVHTALDMGLNVFLTGSAGSGKTACLSAWLATRTPGEVAVTASTGIAATNLGGTTVHRWSGAGIGDMSVDQIVRTKFWRLGRLPGIRLAKTLIVDEVSMLSAKMLTAVDQLCQRARVCNRPFGGLQVVFVGDFGQLAPVDEKEGFAFESPSWAAAAPASLELTQVVRQTDARFIAFLEGIRCGHLSLEAAEMIRSRERAYNPDERGAVRLTTHRAQADKVNDAKLAFLAEPEARYEAIDTGEPSAAALLDKSCRSPRVLRLRKWARVLFTKNDPAGLFVNGTLGTVVDLEPLRVRLDSGAEHDYTITPERALFEIKEPDEKGKLKRVASRAQYPLKLAWASTIHACVVGDTLVATQRGLVPIEDLTEGCAQREHRPARPGLTVGDEHGWADAGEVYRGGEVPTVRIRTRLGFEIEGSLQHPIRVVNAAGEKLWVPLGQVQLGAHCMLRHGVRSHVVDCVQTDAFKPTRGRVGGYPHVVDTELGWLLGALVGDGCQTDVADGRVELAKGDSGTVERFVSLATKLFGVQVTRRSKGNVSSGYFHGHIVRDFLLWCGLSHAKGPAKQVPPVIFQSPPDVQQAFLRGLFDTDGGFSTLVNFTTTSARLANEVQQLLLSLGVIAKRYMMHGPQGVRSAVWRVEIMGRPMASVFASEVGFYHQGKSRRLATFLASSEGRAPKSNVYQLPHGRELARQVHEEIASKSGKRYGQRFRCVEGAPLSETTLHTLSSASNGRQSLNLLHLQALASELPEMHHWGEACAEAHALVTAGAFFDPVVSISKSTAHVHDLGIPSSHSYISNGIVSHNSQGCTLSLVSIDLQRCFAPGQAYVALSRAKSLDGINIERWRGPGAIFAHPKVLAWERGELEAVR